MQHSTEMDILIAKFFSGEASPEEAMQLEDWAAASPENRSYLNNSTKFFAMNIQLTGVESRHRIWENIKNVVDEPKGTQKGKVINWRWTSVAASVVAILSMALLTYTLVNQQNDDTIYQAGTDSKKVILQDKTAITISPNSSIILDKDYGTANRMIELKGSAQFSVIHDAGRPFIIHVNSFHIKDLGTAFNVKTSPSGAFIFIQVTEGEIAVYDDFGYSEKLNAGEKAVYSLLQKKLHLLHFERAKEPLVIEGKGISPIIQSADTTRKKKTNTTASSTDSLTKKYANQAYPSSYPLDKGYIPETIQALLNKENEATKNIISDLFKEQLAKESEASRGIINNLLKDGMLKEAELRKTLNADMLKDGLITKDEDASFKLSNKVFIINGKRQSDAIWQRYLKKYGPSLNTTGDWSWTHNFSEPNVKN